MADDLMPLTHAHDALSDAVTRFHNDMLRQGRRELSPRQWAEEFRRWFNSYDFEEEYKRTMKWLAEYSAESVTDTASDKPEDGSEGVRP